MTTNNTQAATAGEQADEIIKQLATPQAPIETKQASVQVLDQAQPVTAAPEEDWKSRFTGYRTSADKTIHKLRQQVSQFDLMQNENETLKKKLADTQAQIPQTPSEMLELFSEEEVAGMEKMFGGKVGALEAEVERLNEEKKFNQQERANRIAKEEHHSVVDAVARAVPNYNEIDVNPAFAQWMNEVDTFGNVRLELLRKAKAENPPDIGRIVSFYTEFISEQQVVAAQAPTQYTQQELMQQPKTQAGSGQISAPQSLGIKWDTATTSQFYKDRATGKISPEEAEALEKDLYRALKH